MKRNPSMMIKAAFLLVVFALNTLVGFACSVGVNMGFNSEHHKHGTSTPAAKHSDQAKNHHHHQSEGQHKDCCTGGVKQFHDLDKSIPDTKNIVHPVIFSPFYAAYYTFQLLHPPVVVKDIKSFVQQYHPPISNLRIAIRSFQI